MNHYWGYQAHYLIYGSTNTHGSPKVCDPVNFGSHITHVPKRILFIYKTKD